MEVDGYLEKHRKEILLRKTQHNKTISVSGKRKGVRVGDDLAILEYLCQLLFCETSQTVELVMFFVR